MRIDTREITAKRIAIWEAYDAAFEDLENDGVGITADDVADVAEARTADSRPGLKACRITSHRAALTKWRPRRPILRAASDFRPDLRRSKPASGGHNPQGTRQDILDRWHRVRPEYVEQNVQGSNPMLASGPKGVDLQRGRCAEKITVLESVHIATGVTRRTGGTPKKDGP
jgi:hypothetical protein